MHLSCLNETHYAWPSCPKKQAGHIHRTPPPELLLHKEGPANATSPSSGQKSTQAPPKSEPERPGPVPIPQRTVPTHFFVISKISDSGLYVSRTFSNIMLRCVFCFLASCTYFFPKGNFCNITFKFIPSDTLLLSPDVMLMWFPSESNGVIDRTMSLAAASKNEDRLAGMSSCLHLFNSVCSPGMPLPLFSAGSSLPDGLGVMYFTAGLSPPCFSSGTPCWYGLDFLDSVVRGSSS